VHLLRSMAAACGCSLRSSFTATSLQQIQGDNRGSKSMQQCTEQQQQQNKGRSSRGSKSVNKMMRDKTCDMKWSMCWLSSQRCLVCHRPQFACMLQLHYPAQQYSAVLCCAVLCCAECRQPNRAPLGTESVLGWLPCCADPAVIAAVPFCLKVNKCRRSPLALMNHTLQHCRNLMPCCADSPSISPAAAADICLSFSAACFWAVAADKPMCCT